MKISRHLLAAALRNYERRYKQNPHDRKISAEELIHTIANKTMPGAEPSARDLIQRMAQQKWHITDGVHRFSDSSRPAPDDEPHVTVQVGGLPRRSHVYLKPRNGTVWKVTMGLEGRVLFGNEPHVGPQSAPGRYIG